MLKTQLAAKKEGYADVVYLDAKTDTFLEEVSSCNIFTVQGKTIRTPPIEVRIAVQGARACLAMERSMCSGATRAHIEPVQGCHSGGNVWLVGSNVASCLCQSSCRASPALGLGISMLSSRHGCGMRRALACAKPTTRALGAGDHPARRDPGLGHSDRAVPRVHGGRGAGACRRRNGSR